MKASVWLTLTLLGLIGYRTAASAPEQELHPGGRGDDTAQLQAALSKCARAKPSCEVRLGVGVFYTDTLLVKGFNGVIKGRGQGRTIIRPLNYRPLSVTPKPFIDDPQVGAHYPVLLHLADNPTVEVSDLEFQVPGSMRTMPYELPYPGYEGQIITEALAAPILIDGDRRAEALLTHVTFVGVANDTYDGSSIGSAARFEGQIRYINGEDHTRIMRSGRLVFRENQVRRSGFGFQVSDANHLDVLIADNRMDSRIYAVDLGDLGASKVAVLHNNIDAELDGVLVLQTPEHAPAHGSDYLISQNKVRVNVTGGAVDLDPAGGYGGISVFDFAAQPPEGEPPVGYTFKANVVIYDNDVFIPENPVTDGIDVSGDGAGKMLVLGNRVHGSPYDSGILITESDGTVVADNDLRGVDPPNDDVHLTATARNCRVVERGDTVLDEGLNNHVTK